MGNCNQNRTYRWPASSGLPDCRRFSEALGLSDDRPEFCEEELPDALLVGTELTVEAI